MAVLFTVLCGASALCLGYFITFFAKGHFVHSTEAVLDSQITVIKASNSMKDGIDGDYFYSFLNDDGSFSEPIPAEIERFSEGIIVFDYPKNNQRYAAKIYSHVDGRKLLIGFNITEISKDFERMQIMGIFSIIFVMIIVFVSYLISVFVARGTNKIAVTAQEIIDTGDLSRRLEFNSRWDDLSHMALVLNALLSRMEELIIGVRQVSDNIAHDLRTPLTRIRNKIETLQDKYGDQEHDQLLNEADHLLSTFTALLRISRIETEKQRSQFQKLDLGPLIQDVANFYAPLAEEKGVKFDVEPKSAIITGDRDLLFQVYANLLDNAIKFTPAGGRVTLNINKEHGGIWIVIEDTGKGVDETEIHKIFDRFYRAEKSRSSPGTGLGLSLVKAVIDLHGGEAKAENTEDGLRIITIL